MFDKEAFEEAVKEYGRACADAHAASEWGCGVASAEAYEKECFSQVMEFVKNFTNEKAP